LKKFDMEAYTQRKIREYKGEVPPMRPVDKEIEDYTSKRLRELRGETVYWSDGDSATARYCALRIRELKLERFLRDRKLLLDNRKLGSYTVSTMGDHDGES
jgi:hypothetical protein